MRKTTRIFFIILMCVFLLTGCGEKKDEIDPLSQDMMDKIDTIGEVTIDDKELIEDLMQTYSEMTERQKDQVKNYITLKNAKDELDVCLKEENEKQFAEQREYYQLVNEGLEHLKSHTKHPASLTVSGVIVLFYRETDSTFGPDVTFEYSAENDLGNTVSDYIKYSNDLGPYLNTEDYVKDSYLKWNSIIQSGEETANYNSETAKKESENMYSYQPGDDVIYVFKLDFEDYESQGYSLPQ